jgi:DNA-binding CsgD family transcriptional regulator
MNIQCLTKKRLVQPLKMQLPEMPFSKSAAGLLLKGKKLMSCLLTKTSKVYVTNETTGTVASNFTQVSDTKAKNRIGLTRTFIAFSPAILGLALTRMLRLAVSHTDATLANFEWLNDFAALITLTALATPLLFIIVKRIHPSQRFCLTLGYGSVAIAIIALLAMSGMRTMGFFTQELVLVIIIASYCAEIAGLYFWLYNLRKTTPAQAIIVVFAATMVTDVLSHIVVGFLNIASYQICLLLALSCLCCIFIWNKSSAGKNLHKSLNTTWNKSWLHSLNKFVIKKTAAADSANFMSNNAEFIASRHNQKDLLSMATTNTSKMRVVALVSLSIALLTFSVGLLLGFVPKTYVDLTQTVSPAKIFIALALRELITLGACVFFILRAWQGRLLQLSVIIIQILALLAFAVLPCSMLLDSSPIHIDTILANSLYTLLTGFSWYLAIFFMSQSDSDDVSNSSVKLFTPAFHAIAALYCCLLPRSLARGVLFPLFDGENGFVLFVIVISGTALVAIAGILSLYLRGAIGEQLANPAQNFAGKSDKPSYIGLIDNETNLSAITSEENTSVSPLLPKDLANLRIKSMRSSVAWMGKSFRLSERELEVLALYALGYTRKRVAKELFISHETVNTHIKNIYTKTNIGSRQKMLDCINAGKLP